MGTQWGRQSYGADECIFREGEAGDTAYLIETGQVEITVIRNGSKVVLATLGDGELFGEMALIGRYPRSACASALTAVIVVPIGRELLDSIGEQVDPLFAHLMRLVVDRYREAHLFRFDALESRSAPALRPDHASDADAAKISATERIRLDQDIREGIANDEFYPFYQPIVDLRDGSIAGFEALVRWRRTGNVVVSPGQFVALAEQTGAIVEIGRRVFSEAVQMLQELDELCERPLFMSINLSARQMRDTQELELLMNMVEQASVPARQIKLELTESMLIDDFDAAVIALDGFKRLGLQLAIDDFGTGYSSLSYLQRFALDTLKIDRSFVDGMVRKPDSERIVRAIAGLARDLGMNIVAEGIETREQEACLQAFGCEYGQGFLYSRPVDRAAALALMRGESSVRPD